MITNFEVSSLLPRNSPEENLLIEDIISINRQIKDDFTEKELLELTKLRMATSETIDHSAWFQAHQFLENNMLTKKQDAQSFKELISQTNEIITGEKNLRNKIVTAGSQQFPSPSQVKTLWDNFCSLIPSIKNPISKAGFIYQGICSIHPFINGNGRTGRLVADFILMEEEFSPLIFPTPIAAFVIPTIEDLGKEHLLVLKKIKMSSNWIQKLYPKD